MFKAFARDKETKGSSESRSTEGRGGEWVRLLQTKLTTRIRNRIRAQRETPNSNPSERAIVEELYKARNRYKPALALISVTVAMAAGPSHAQTPSPLGNGPETGHAVQMQNKTVAPDNARPHRDLALANDLPREAANQALDECGETGAQVTHLKSFRSGATARFYEACPTSEGQ